MGGTAMGVAFSSLHVGLVKQLEGKGGGERLADQLRCCLLRHPHWHAIPAAGAAHHIAVVVQDHVQPRTVGEIEQCVQSLEECRVERVFVPRLRASPDHAEADCVPPELLNVIGVRAVEGRAALARARVGARCVCSDRAAES